MLNVFVFRQLVCDEKGVQYLAKRLLSQGGTLLGGGVCYFGGWGLEVRSGQNRWPSAREVLLRRAIGPALRCMARLL